MTNLNALFGKPDYSHIAHDTTATISIAAYDRGVDQLDAEAGQALDSVIAKLKDQVWP